MTAQSLSQFRMEILDKIGISYDYYPPYDGVDNHCRWVCVDIECNAPAFKSYPAFKKHLAKAHGITFSEVSWMRWY